MSQSLDFHIIEHPVSASDGVGLDAILSVDFLIGGQSLLASLDPPEPDEALYRLAGRFEQGRVDQNKQVSAQFLNQTPAETKDGRVLFYVCHVCGDIGCGSYAAKIEIGPTVVTWSDFAYENGYEPARRIPEIGPFSFPIDEYKAVIQRAVLI